MSNLPDAGTPDDPWRLQTPPLASDFSMHRDLQDGRDILVCTVGKTVLLYDARCLEHLHAMLKEKGEWVELGSADEQKEARSGTVEAWARAAENPIGGVVRSEKRAARTFRDVCAPAYGAARSCGGRAQSARQSNAG